MPQTQKLEPAPESRSYALHSRARIGPISVCVSVAVPMPLQRR